MIKRLVKWFAGKQYEGVKYIGQGLYMLPEGCEFTPLEKSTDSVQQSPITIKTYKTLASAPITVFRFAVNAFNEIVQMGYSRKEVFLNENNSAIVAYRLNMAEVTSFDSMGKREFLKTAKDKYSPIGILIHTKWKAKYWFITIAFVSEEERGCGIFAKMLHHLEIKAGNEGIKYFGLGTHRNNKAMQAVIKKHRPHAKCDMDGNVLYYVWKIGK